MKKITLILCALIFLSPTIVFAQVAAPPQTPAGPLLIEVSPSSGEQGQTLGLALYGENFQNGAQVSFNPADGIFINSIIVTVEKITLQISIANNASPSSRDVIVTNPNQITATYNDGFLVKVPVDITPPPPILGLTAADAFDGKIDLAWLKNDAPDFDHYAIYWNETVFVNLTGHTPDATISDQNTATFQTTGLTNGTRYFFAVTAVDKTGNEDKNVVAVSAVPTPSTVPPVTVPFPTAPATNLTPAPTAPSETEKISGEVFPADFIPVIILVALAALGGLIYSFIKHRVKKPLDIKKEIKRKEEFRFLNKDSKFIKLEIAINGGKTVDLVREIGNLSEEYKTAGIPVNLTSGIFDAQKDTLQKILGGGIPTAGSDKIEYSIIISPVSGVDIEWQMAEVSLNGLQPASKYEIKKQGDNFTYEKNVKVMKADEAWKKYADDLAPDFADLKKIIKVHLDDLGQQEEKFKKL